MIWVNGIETSGNISQYIHCSSTGGYAPLPFVPCDETAPYGGFEKTSGWAAKAVYDNEAMRLFHEEGFPATVIRPCYITGPGMLPLDNQGGRRKDYIADIIAEKTLDVPDNGLALLQPIHVKDLAASFRLAAETHRSIGQIYNICLSHAFTLNDYLKLTASVFNRKAVINHMSVDSILKKYGGSVGELDLRFFAEHTSLALQPAKLWE